MSTTAEPQVSEKIEVATWTYDQVAVKKELEQRFLTRIPEDDSLWLTLAGIEIVVKQIWQGLAAHAAEMILQQTSDFQGAVAAATKEHVSAMNKAADRIKKDIDVSGCAMLSSIRTLVKLESEPVEDTLREEIEELKGAIERFETAYSSSRWKLLLLGLLCACALLICGGVLGVLLFPGRP